MEPIAGRTGPAGREFEYTARDFERVRALIRQRAGIALAPGKQDMVYSRLSRRLRQHGLSRFRDYLDALEAVTGEDGEWQAFTNALTTNLTSFFREAHHFDVLRQHLRLIEHPSRRVLLWSAAASTGEEPYSIAMTVMEHYDSAHPPVSILATDIDTQVLETARRGVYPLETAEKLSPERRRRFFKRGAGAAEGWCRVNDEVRQLVSFRPLNLLDSSYQGLRGPFDAIFCRNVMIYFDKPTQLQVLRRLLPLLAPDGLFFAGHSESFYHAAELMAPVGRTVYRRADGRRWE